MRGWNPFRRFSRWVFGFGEPDHLADNIADWTMPITGENIESMGSLDGASIWDAAPLDGSSMTSLGTVEGSNDGD